MALVPRGRELSHFGDGVTIVREAGQKDLRGIVRLHGEAGELWGRLDPGWAPGPGQAERFERMVGPMIKAREVGVLVAEAGMGDGLGGFALGTVVNNNPFVVSRFGYISCLYVGQEYRGRGLGTALCEGWRHRLAAEGLAAAQTEVCLRDPAAQRFWRAQGFRSFLDHLWSPACTGRQVDLNSPWEVRGAGRGDSEAMLSLWQEMMDVHSALDERLRVGPGWKLEVAELLRRSMGGPHTRVIVADGPGGVIGFALGSIVEKAWGVKPSRDGHVAHLCVTAEYRRRGVGHQLFGWLRDWFQRREAASIHLYASPLNPVSHQFWRSLGFEGYAERLWCSLD